jgi:hypothetical protein
MLEGLSESRRSHSLEVGRKARGEAWRVALALRHDLALAATLHDVGYGHPRTGFHPLDGADFLASQGFSVLVCHLVAHHSASMIEAEVRGIPLSAYGRFAVDLDAADLKALNGVPWWADMTTGPDGSTVSVEERLAEIEARYGPDDLVTTFIRRARPVLLAAGQSPAGSK